MRAIYISVGLMCLALGAIGAFLPLIPTVPLWLLAAFCFARSSERLHHWMITHPVIGPPILDWHERGAIGARSKRLATLSIMVVFGISLALKLAWTVLAIQGLVLLGVLTFIWTRPSR